MVTCWAFFILNIATYAFYFRYFWQHWPNIKLNDSPTKYNSCELFLKLIGFLMLSESKNFHYYDGHDGHGTEEYGRLEYRFSIVFSWTLCPPYGPFTLEVANASCLDIALDMTHWVLRFWVSEGQWKCTIWRLAYPPLYNLYVFFILTFS